LPQVLPRCPLNPATAKKRVEQAGLLGGAITPTGGGTRPALPVTAEAVPEGALSIDHVAAVAEVMKGLPAAVEG
jgi:5-methylcytosine-specific restriction protein A